ncbi:Uncharacterised protein [Zhongshania aliphaticivorans]|uniref:Lipoprotein n=1 Tax=Zhongshania aliphaticivorans TaxID=1470434 RepID=A0A5S9NB82_9GAMM|nr:hypothetical protein [Zhongshania aliphaticivorans]CAA0080817.1 Uncharacterised protein [Zhongshania aliphaticivorans]CAA0085467.1 Uncharacterised protein [Zhongshania aliphaticivorans]
MKMTKLVFSVLVLLTVLLTSACGPLIHASSPAADEEAVLANGHALLDAFEAKIQQGQYTLEEPNGYSRRTTFRDSSNREIPLRHFEDYSCLSIYKLWPNENFNAYAKNDGLIRALEERYGILYQKQREEDFYWDYTYDHPKMHITSRRVFVVGDGTQVFEVYQKTLDPRRGCALLNLSRGDAYVKQYIRLYSIHGEPDLARLTAPVTDPEAYIKAVIKVDGSYDYSARKYAEALENNGRRNAAFELRNRESARMSNEHFAATYNRVMSQTAATAKANSELHQRYRDRANNSYQSHKWRSNGGSSSSNGGSVSSGSSSSGGSNSWDKDFAERRERARNEEMRNTVLATEAIEKSQQRQEARTTSEPVKGTQYTKVSLEAYGTTDMHFAYDQALNLAETNAYNAAASSCAAQNGRLEKGSGTMAKKNCKENGSGEHRCEVNMLFTCNKR